MVHTWNFQQAVDFMRDRELWRTFDRFELIVRQSFVLTFRDTITVE